MSDKAVRMQAPKGTTSANIEGHTYEVPKNGIITVAQDNHITTLRRHGFTDALDQPEDAAEFIENCSDKDELVEFIEERGGEADNDMGLKKLRRLAREAANVEE